MTGTESKRIKNKDTELYVRSDRLGQNDIEKKGNVRDTRRIILRKREKRLLRIDKR